jgi:NAD(P)-dependent dehydrogenase (short-subunit alcohol dehydrogenase family)
MRPDIGHTELMTAPPETASSAPRTDGEVALVTGGGSGIGWGCARELARSGAAVVLAGRNAERLNAGKAALVAELPEAADRIFTQVCDVTSEDAVIAACDRAAALGRFTMLVVNAGFGSAGPLEATTLAQWEAVLATNLTGAFLTIRSALPHLAATAPTRPGGSAIVAVSSIASSHTHRYMTPYAVSKAGLDMLIRQTADEMGSVGIRANSVRPGLVPTDATTVLMSVPAIHEDYLAQMPIGQVGSPEEVAALVAFLAGPQSAWITGACIPVDGGHHLRRGPDLSPVMPAFGSPLIR